MKTIIRTALTLTAFATLAIASTSQAQLIRIGEKPVDGELTVEEREPLPSTRQDLHNPRRVSSRRGNLVAVTCAQEVVAGNVAATERTLNQISAMPQFANAKTFKAEIAAIAKLPSGDQKAEKYFSLVGVDAANSEEVVEFIGARDVKPKHIIELEKNLDLTSPQAEIIATKLQNNLRGGLK